MKNSISNHKLNKCIDKIMIKCDSQGTRSLGLEDIQELCSDPDIIPSIRKLQALHEIDCKYPGLGGSIPYFLTILPDGELHDYRIHQEHVEFWKGFATGIFATVLGTVISQLILRLL